MRRLVLPLLTALVWTTAVKTDAAEMRMAVTTSFQNSGLADMLLPRARDDLGFDIRLVVTGTGQALRLGRAGDVDAVLVHSRKAEEAFVADGFARQRREIMYNDFVIIGPADDPAAIAQAGSAKAALASIRETRSPFVSRGDDSGTHRREVALWQETGQSSDEFVDGWYRAVGAGMGAALNTASGMNAYILADRASWLNFGNKGDLKLLYSGDPALFNQYAYLAISQQRHPHVKYGLAERFGDWLAGERGQKLIGAYTLGGQTLFTPNARKTPEDSG